MHQGLQRKIRLGAFLLLILIVAVALQWNRNVLSVNHVAVQGEFRPDEMREIFRGVERVVVPPLWESIVKSGWSGISSALKDRRAAREVEIIRIERRTAGFVAVIGKYPDTSTFPDKYVFWSAFLEDNSWRVEKGRSIPDYGILK